MNCNDAMAALVASLENATTVDEETREHLRTCEQCGAMLRSAKEVLSAPAGVTPAMDAAVAAAEREVARKRFWRGVRILGGALAAAFAILVGALLVLGGEVRLPQALIFAAAGLVLATIVSVPILLTIWLVRGSQRRVYKRLGPGRMLSGVCLGIAEAMKIDVRMLRIVFVVLLFFDGAGFWIYLLLDLAMPVHPDDRQHLLRFKLRRWWNRMRNAEQRAG
jgi:phage shock protein PspC (stress-responsive transcriptional regulator)